MDFFYDAATRRYLLQFSRIFSSIKVRLGPDSSGLYSIQRVPLLYGDPSSMVAQIIKGQSENTLMPSPMFSVWIDSIKLSPNRRQATQYVGKTSTVEREFNYQTNTYGSGPGIRQDIERYMAVPYDYYFQLDVWTTNTETKLQILEQIQMIFNPSLQLQQNDNILDWTSIFEVWLEDIIWTNRNIQQGDTIQMDIMSFKFKIQGWINPPAKLKRSGLIAEIVTNVFQDVNISSLENINDVYDPFSALSDIPVQIVTTEGDYKISVSKGTNSDIITLLNQYGQEDPTLSWQDLIQKYGQITPDITKLILKLDPNIEIDTSDIIGTIAQNPSNQTQLFYTVNQDTLPANTLLPINTIIDPTEVTPGHGLPSAIAGQRYLLTSGDSTGKDPAIPPGIENSPWGNTIVAYPNDIIEFNGITWIVAFDSKNSTGKNYVINNENGYQYTFDGKEWTYTYYGIYQPGYWILNNLIYAPNGTTISNYE